MTVQDRTPERLGPYRLLERLGEGGMGIVYLARDSAERMVAVKALRPSVAAEPTARRRLAREVETMRRVHSPFVAEVIDADVTSDPPYIVTRYVPGRTLEDIVGESGPLAGAALARLATGLAAALTAVHAAGVVHRDLKPGNVLMVDGEPVVIDFGIAQLPETTRLTMTGMFMGTPGYLAPEVIEGRQSSSAADVHSWGATMAFAATGRPPFGTGTFETIFYRIVHGQPDLDACPSPLLWLVVRALARDPARRPAAGELSEWAAALDPSSLVPGAAAGGAAGGAAGAVAAGAVNFGAAGAWPAAPAGSAVPVGTRADLPASGSGPPVPWQHVTRPLDGGDFRDLLPPVSYGQPAAKAGAAQGSPPAAGPGAAQPAAAGQATAPPVRSTPRSAWSPLVLAVLAAAAALSVAFPVAGTAAALAFLIAASAVGLTGSRVARRRSRQGSRPADPLVAAVFFPVALCREVIRFLLLAPLAALGAGVVAAITIISVSRHPLPLAFALGAGTLIAVYGIGPGSAGCRRPLSKCFGSGRSIALTVIAFIGIAAAAVGAIALAASQPPSFWPEASPSAQLMLHPALHSALYDVRTSLVRLARHFGV
jgi:predicted Ser/Thr protein kinase